MSMDMTVTVTLDDSDPAAAGRFEDAFRAWARSQPMVKAVDMTQQSRWDGNVWKQARKERFGSKLGNPFGRTTLGR